MYKLYIMLFVFIAPQVFASTECSRENTYLTKEGYFGAVNQESLKNNDASSREFLLKNKSIIMLPAGVKACLTDDGVNFYDKQKRVDITGFDVPYWVSDEALTPVK